MKKTDFATWTKTKQGWQLIITFTRHWEAPPVGEGEGMTFTIPVFKKGQHEGKPTALTLTSNCFSRDGKLKAFAEEA